MLTNYDRFKTLKKCLINKIGGYLRQQKVKRPEDLVRINDKIKVESVRLLDEEGEMLGVFSTPEALTMARERELDLVEISPNADPPVCQIIDYGKFSYQVEKKKKEAKKNQKVVHLKEIKLRPKTDVHDYNFKVKHVQEFLEDGDRVKITIRFKGREMAYIDSGKEQINRVIADTEGLAKPEGTPRLEGRNLSVTLVPIK